MQIIDTVEKGQQISQDTAERDKCMGIISKFYMQTGYPMTVQPATGERLKAIGITEKDGYVVSKQLPCK